jgi:4'-phosphopantetheinyl transferase
MDFLSVKKRSIPGAESLMLRGLACRMSSFKLPRTILVPLTLQRSNLQLEATLVVASSNTAWSLMDLSGEIFGKAEAAYLSTLQFERRQKSYLLGRYAAKMALGNALAESDLRTIEIERGVFEQPVVRYPGDNRWDVTISHTEFLAAALAYPRVHPMGIDIERIDAAGAETASSQLSKQEAGWLESQPANRLETIFALWTAKEALSKALRTGLTSPIEIYNLAEFSRINRGIWEGLFLNFAQYKARVWIGSSSVLAIVLPKKSTIFTEADLCGIL